MQAKEIRQRFIDFFVVKHNHNAISSASLIPENDPTVLFTTAGMQPLVPFLMGEAHPLGTRLVDCQKCVRTDDIDEVGDHTHCTFFEMLGNWSLGDYFKKEAIEMSYQFLTTPLDQGGMGIAPDKLCVSCFAGDQDAARDEEAAKVWESLGFVRADQAGPEEKKRIYFYGKKQNWWGPAGQTGPCGPDTEIFYNLKEGSIGANEHPDDDSGRFVEIWNNVFMQYNKTADGKIEPLKQQNVDTGMGLERMTAIMQGVPSHYESSLFDPVRQRIMEMSSSLDLSLPEDLASTRIIMDHIRAATFIIGDPSGVAPSNTDQGYILRRLIRRAIRHAKKLGIEDDFTTDLAKLYIDEYGEAYPELVQHKERIFEELHREEAKFKRTLENGLREMKKLFAGLNESEFDERQAAEKGFFLYETYGFPVEMIIEELEREGVKFDKTLFKDVFERKFKEHQDQSRAGAEQKFAGGLADHSEETTKLHTATHLLHKALRQVLGDDVEQRGSNITAERLRFDFNYQQKLTPEQLAEVEQIVNDAIKRDLPVSCDVMTVDEAKSSGAIGIFDCKYGDQVKVYTMGDFSKEICGGPHVAHTGMLKGFKIKKEEASSAGVRRIKAIVGEI